MKEEFQQAISDYFEEKELFEKALDFAVNISINQGRIPTDGRGTRASKIFTRQTLTGLSLGKILPKTIEELWDIGSIASLTRNLIEGYLSLYYYGTEKISDEEAEFRFFLLQLDKNRKWLKIRKSSMSSSELTQFKNGVTMELDRINNHSFYSKLTSLQKNKIKQGQDIYTTKAEFEEKLIICKDLNSLYTMLSNLIHVLPLSIERIGNTNGRGDATKVDVAYALNCVMLSRRFLITSTIEFAELFPKDLAKKFEIEINNLSCLINKGFNQS